MISVLLAGMAGIVLLIASLNLANMILARGTARSREIAMRLAIGATRWQIVRQLLVEGVTLALAGGGLGLLLAYWANTLLERSFTTLLGSMNFSLTADLRPDAVVLAVTFGFCLLATLLFSLGPALKSARTDIVSELKNQGAESTATGRLTRFFAPRHLLVMAQMTLALVLIFSAGLFFRGALNAGGLQLGFDPAGVVLTEMDFSLANTPQPEAPPAHAGGHRSRAEPAGRPGGGMVDVGSVRQHHQQRADHAGRRAAGGQGRARRSAAGRLRRLREHHSRISGEHRRPASARPFVFGARIAEEGHAARVPSG